MGENEREPSSCCMTTQPNWNHASASTCCTCARYGGVVHLDSADTGVHCARGWFAVPDGHSRCCSAYVREPGADDEGDRPELWKATVDAQRELLKRHDFPMAWAGVAFNVPQVGMLRRPLLRGVRKVEDFDDLLTLYGYSRSG